VVSLNPKEQVMAQPINKQAEAEIERLEGEIDERRARVGLLREPLTPDEVSRLAREDPDRFNAMWEDGLIPNEALAGIAGSTSKGDA
jgi:hypothetical protein